MCTCSADAMSGRAKPLDEGLAEATLPGGAPRVRKVAVGQRAELRRGPPRVRPPREVGVVERGVAVELAEVRGELLGPCEVVRVHKRVGRRRVLVNVRRAEVHHERARLEAFVELFGDVVLNQHVFGHEVELVGAADELLALLRVVSDVERVVLFLGVVEAEPIGVDADAMRHVVEQLLQEAAVPVAHVADEHCGLAPFQPALALRLRQRRPPRLQRVLD
mmetsp:Transcript_14167/g.33410  ORF Transcript_14167/g.33410 Transcript_14167/m.33410 type:complete len:220 (+) Transcript_14167:261-920(+)